MPSAEVVMNLIWYLLKHPLSFKIVAQRFILYVMLSILGFIFIKYFTVPIIDQLMDVIKLIANDINTYLEPLSEYYQVLVDENFFETIENLSDEILLEKFGEKSR